jgi:hypothetical protein
MPSKIQVIVTIAVFVIIFMALLLLINRSERHKNAAMSPEDVAALNVVDRAIVEAYWMANHAPITYRIFNDAKSENDLRIANESAMEDQKKLLNHR